MSAASLRTRGSVAGVLALALAATACGGSSSGAVKAGAASTTTAAATTTAAGGSAAATTTSAPGASSTAAATTTAGATTAPPTAAATTKVKATGGGDFCKSIANAINNPIKPGAISSAKDEEALIKASLAQGEAALSKAPSAIKPDVIIVLGAVDKLLKALQTANYDYTKIDPKAFTALSTPQVTAAEAHVVAYVKTDCGIDVGTATG